MDKLRLKQKEEFILDSTKKTLKRSEYNGLTDPNLSFFFSSPSRKKLLIKQRLISPAGEINDKLINKRISSKGYKLFAEAESRRSPYVHSMRGQVLPVLTTKKILSHSANKLSGKRAVTAEEFKNVLLIQRLKLGKN